MSFRMQKPHLPVPESRAEVTGRREGSDPLGTDSALGRMASVTRGHCRPRNSAGSGSHRPPGRADAGGLWGGRRPGCSKLICSSHRVQGTPSLQLILLGARTGPRLVRGHPSVPTGRVGAERGSLPLGVVWTQSLLPCSPCA